MPKSQWGDTGSDCAVGRQFPTFFTGAVGALERAVAEPESGANGGCRFTISAQSWRCGGTADAVNRLIKRILNGPPRSVAKT
jgi:hypothetical protein